MSSIADKILLVKTAYESLVVMSDEDFINTSYWQYILDNGGENFTAAISLLNLDQEVTRTIAISLMRHVLIVLYQQAWMENAIPIP